MVRHTVGFQSARAGPEAEFSAVPDTASTGESIKFDASASSPGWNGTDEMSITEYRWNFGGGISITTSTPIVYYSFISPGIYYVTLTVYAPGAIPETDTTSREVTIIPAPIGGYSLAFKEYTAEKPLTLYLALAAILTVSIIMTKRKISRRFAPLSQPNQKPSYYSGETVGKTIVLGSLWGL